MNIYNNLNDDIKMVFLFKVGWSGLMLLSVIYCITILSISRIIDHFSWILAVVLFFNTLSSLFSVTDVWLMILNNKREKDSWFPDFIYGIFSIMIPVVYYLHMGITISKGEEYKFRGEEFVVILMYTIVYTIIIIGIIIAGIIGLFGCISNTKKAVDERNNIKTSSDIKLDSPVVNYEEISANE